MESNIKDTVVDEVRQDLLNRSEVGIKKYNTTLDRIDLEAEDWIEHAYQEALDFALYLKRLKRDIIAVKSMLKGTGIKYEVTSTSNSVKPNETYMDAEPIKPKIRGWHF